jgi:hypothetical protein
MLKCCGKWLGMANIEDFMSVLDIDSLVAQ